MKTDFLALISIVFAGCAAAGQTAPADESPGVVSSTEEPAVSAVEAPAPPSMDEPVQGAPVELEPTTKLEPVSAPPEEIELIAVELPPQTPAADPVPISTDEPAVASDETPALVAPESPAVAPAQETGGFDHTHARWDRVLKQHVEGAFFDYEALEEDVATLNAYIRELKAVRPADLEGWTKEQRYAFWINAYNAFTVKKVVGNLPLKSIRDLDKGFGLTDVFEQSFIALETLHPSGKKKKLSLNDIEHEILRKRFKDARVHAAVNCASWSCPTLLGEAFVADRLEAQLDAQMRAFVADRERNVFDRSKKAVKLSKIFDWFGDDFKRDAGSVRDYLLRYATEEDAAFLRDAKIGFVDYSWKLNAPKQSKKKSG